MDAITMNLADRLAEELSLPTTPDDEVERMEDMHRRGVATYMKRATEARRRGKGAVAELEDERKRLQQVYREDMTRIDAEVAASKAATAAEVAACDKLAAVSRAALEALVAS